RKNNAWKRDHLPAEIAKIKRRVKAVKVKQAVLFKVDELKLSAQALKGKALFLGRGICFTCHKMGDKGREVGPNLSLIGAKYSAAVIKEAVVNPSSAIVFGYELTEVKTKDGSMHSGFIISDGDPLILKNIGGQNVEIQRAQISSLQTSQKSLMPSAKALNLSDQNLEAIAVFLIEAAAQKVTK
ncbi:MAG: c-type cytochrome, partial [Lentisphaeraceae bacterium]|nr:c-type cytochrome [Lentisphaeraceae bacterium]